MQISEIPPEQVTFFWPSAKKFIEASQRRGPTDMTTQDILNELRTDERWRLLIFDCFAGAAVVRVWDDWLHVVAIGGKLDKGWEDEFFLWLSLVAGRMGSKYITLGGRRGWERKLKRLGFKNIGGPFLGAEILREREQ